MTGLGRSDGLGVFFLKSLNKFYNFALRNKSDVIINLAETNFENIFFSQKTVQNASLLRIAKLKLAFEL